MKVLLKNVGLMFLLPLIETFPDARVIKKIDTVEQTKIPVKDIFEYDYSEIRKQPEYRKSGIMTHFWEHSWIHLEDI